MKLIYIHQYFETPGQFGSLRSYKNALHMVKKGHSVTVISGSEHYHSSKKQDKGKGLFSRENIDGIDVLWVNTLFPYHKSYLTRLLSFISFVVFASIAGIKLKADAVYATSTPLTVILPAYIISRLRRMPLYFEVRDLWPESAVKAGVLKNRLIIFIAEWLERFAYKRSDKIIAVSDSIKEELINMGVPERKLSVVYHGVDIELFQKTKKGAFRAEYGLKDEFLVVYAGSFGYANCLETVLKAAEMTNGNKEIKYVLIGDGKEKQKLLAIKNEKRLDNVVFAKPVPKNMIFSVLNDCDAGLMILRDIPTFKTVLPNKLLDYMASSLPVIINFKGFASGIVDRSGSGVVIEGDSPEALKEAVLKLKNTGSREMGVRARAYVEENFLRDTMVRRFEKIVTEA